ncbi:MAG: DegT/DnrJ/EryC1/StrS family aminotransferase [Thermoplasmata archaeon]
MRRRPLSPRPRSAPILVTRPSLPPFEEYARHLRRIWKSRYLTNGGPYLKTLEQELVRYLPASNVAVVANGTLALQLALHSVSRKKGVVITTPFTFAATTTSLVWEGFTPRFADIDPETFNLDPDSVADRFDDDVVGVLSVHVFGNPAGARGVAGVAKEHNRWMIFDAAPSLGVRTQGRSLYELGDASTLSFHAVKTFHTFEGGAITTSSRRIAEQVRRLRNFGFEASGEVGTPDVAAPGINAKMSEAHAAMGVTNLRYVDGWIRARQERYELYRELLEPMGRVGFQHVVACRYNFGYMPILLSSRRTRDRVCQDLQQHGIWPRRYFFPPTSQFTFLRKTTRAPCPVAKNVADRVLTLPLYPDLPLEQVRRIAEYIRRAVHSVVA